ALSKYMPLIIAFNHINFLEVPILVTHSYPKLVTGLVKSETWDNPVFSFLFNSYQAIPIDRAGAFHDVFKRVKEIMDNGYFICVAPEGTRSKNGVLGRGKAGIIHLALDTNSAILPIVHYGGENIWNNMKHFKRTPFCFKAGRAFRLKFEGRPDKDVREQMLCEIMGEMARLLPEERRGPYSGQANANSQYLEYI
ncbi:MAG: 1-acyl-sn-glycerol-3-phosphate acyltransferase, partial [Treponema sp.]|nr:1-acyl-sn-glycerol-3-phosphate acyltransferase [Treponema sp.]